MPSFFNRGNTSSHRAIDEEEAPRIKARIKERLSEAIKAIQSEHGSKHEDIIPSNRLSTTILSAIEAIFIHGLKDSLFGKLSLALGPLERSNASPEPCFWLYLLIFSHREEIDKVNSLSQISSDIGRCRSWLRIVINSGLLTSYLHSMSKDKASARSHYHSHAFIRDPEALDIASQLIKGLEIFTFDMAINSSILNKWQSGPLATAGLIQESTISMALDASSMLLLEPEDIQEQPEKNGSSSQPINRAENIEKSSIRPVEHSIMRGLLNEEEALRLILQSSTPISGSPVTNSTGIHLASASSNLSPPSSLPHPSLTSLPSSLTELKNSPPPSADELLTPPNSLLLQSSSLSSLKDDPHYEEKRYSEDSTDNEEHSIDSDTQCHDEDIRSESESIPDNIPSSSSPLPPPAVLESSRKTSTTHNSSSKIEDRSSKAPRLSGFVDAWDPFGRQVYFDRPSEKSILQESNTTCLGFSFKPDIHVGGLTQEESRYLMSCFDAVTKELGLDDQNWECFSCHKAVGTVFGPYKTCAYTKKYFCTDCHGDDLRYIPYKVVFNWEFTKYPVCKKAKIFLDAIESEPIINVESFNCGLFSYSKDLDAVFTLRKKVSYQYQYLKVCSQSPNPYISLKKQVESRSYLIDDVDTYSLADMEEIFLGTLPALLKALDKSSRNHILSCLICKGHGFICEVCRALKPLYPFELEKISQCEKCFTVFHKECSNSLISCPKCERIESRNLNWHVSNVRIKTSSSSNLINTVIHNSSE
eukprot:TRINITY_DN3197_c0_g1_i2.p1 TRINITY_DN3197_c0_g1~~TRINITY_DN3197_c0_g1_i2.p1  ORF type:complete len:759 (+),score=252.56 TRINITY_DN3197_c0_g1_i2:190-2466(+)